MKKKATWNVRTLVLSDVHLGIPECRVDQVCDLLKHVRCQKLILNGDIIDAWALRRSGRWTEAETRFVRMVLKKMEKQGTEVVYVSGNHDEILRTFLPISLHRLQIVDEHIHESPKGRYLVVHGDGFDVVTRHYRFLAVLGAVGYGALLKLNRAVNRYRERRGKPPYSLSKQIKAKVKGAVSFVGRYEDQLQALAAQRDCDGILCGHIHTPADKRIGKIHYLNSGDWVESSTCLAEDAQGNFRVVNYAQFRKELEALRGGAQDAGATRLAAV